MNLKGRNYLLPYKVIKEAVEGDTEAIQEVLGFYHGYICKLCTQTFYDDSKNVHYVVNQDMVEQLENILVQAIVMNFKIDFDPDEKS